MPAAPVAGLTPGKSQASPAAEPEPTPRIQPAAAAPQPKAGALPSVEPVEARKLAALPSETEVDIPSQEAAAASPPTTPAQTAMTTPPTAVSTRTILFIGAIVLLAMVAGLGLLLRRRPRAAAPASLITRSMDRKEK
jgi:hypothetical protein